MQALLSAGNMQAVSSAGNTQARSRVESMQTLSRRENAPDQLFFLIKVLSKRGDTPNCTKASLTKTFKKRDYSNFSLLL